MELLSRKHWELFLTWTSYTSCVILQRYCTFFCCLTCHLYAHCLFPSYFRKTFLPQWWKHITMKWIATDNLLTPLFRKEVTMFQDLFVLYRLSSFCLSRNNLKLLLKPFSFFLLLFFFGRTCGTWKFQGQGLSSHFLLYIIFLPPNMFNISIWIYSNHQLPSGPVFLTLAIY